MEGPFRETGLTGDDRLIETLLWDGASLVRLDLHLARLSASAQALGFACDLGAAEAALRGAASGAVPLRMRLTLARDGALAVTGGPAGASAAQWRVRLSPRRLDAGDPLRAHKTTARRLYDADRAALPEGVDEWLYANAGGAMVEGTITTLVFDLGDGLRTPPLSEGCLPGVLRRALIAAGELREAPLPLDGLAKARLWCGNSLRGLIPAVLV